MWFTVSLCLYALGGIWIMLTAVEEDGRVKPIIILSIFWPLYAIIVALMQFVSFPDIGSSKDEKDDSDDDTK